MQLPRRPRKNVEAMKKECHGIASSFSLPFVFKFAFLLTCLLLLGLALRVEKQKLSEGVDEMKTLVHMSHNKAKEVITHAEEELAQRRSYDFEGPLVNSS